jgi:hypothetical protein
MSYFGSIAAKLFALSARTRRSGAIGGDLSVSPFLGAVACGTSSRPVPGK